MVSSFQLRQKLEEGKPLIGTVQTLNSPEVTEILAAVGFDWLFIDLEHSILDIEGAQRILQAAGPGCPCIIRPPSQDEVWIKKILDTGAAGIIVPRVKSAEEAARIVKCSKYPPEGDRSVGLSRAHGYGLSFQEYVDSANREIAVILQIEHIDAVREIETIVKIPGIDGLFVGPYDLSGSMGKIGQVNDPEVQQQIQRVRQVCLGANMVLGIFTTKPEDVKPLIEKGFTLIALGIDTMLMGQYLGQLVQSVK
jgi:2-dehydro-3-deoxyglucarate aldolase/4-hydroxy-2-oxoheptanedioate aldolase